MGSLCVWSCPHMMTMRWAGGWQGLWLWERVCFEPGQEPSPAPRQGQMRVLFLHGGERGTVPRPRARREHHPSWRGPCWLAAWRLVSKATTPVAIGTQA